MDKIVLTGVRANGTHGVLDFEQERAQTFVVDVTLFLDLAKAGQSDALSDTVDYGRVAKDIVAVVEGEHVDLIEALAQRIADRILAIGAIARVEVTVHKPHAPITVPFDDVAVTITRAQAKTAHRAVIALGGNQGDVADTLRDAVRRIDALDGTQVIGVSPLYRTAAWGMPAGTPDFLNAVAEVTTTLDAHELLDGLRRIEADHGRTRETHWSNRTLDLDIIDFDGRQSDDPALTLPHPRAWQRAFVLVPWAALDPQADLPGMHGGPVSELAEGLVAEADEPPVELVSSDWLASGESRHTPRVGEGTEAGLQSGTQAGTQSRPAVISLESTSPDAETLFREAIVAIDGIPGNQVEGISPLYHLSNFDGPDAMSAVIQIVTKLGAADLIDALGTIETAHGKAVDLDLVDMDGVRCDEPDCRVPWPSARRRAAVLAPWMDMDPNATLGGDPVAFLLAQAEDAGRVGLLSDAWILGSA
ncbi:2-amino-4-hydroxy-6-hydroxymethyldihydropteridine diphosphokinase [Bifidobacterium panos]|uniref:Bifunctional folate synthesis protein n=1 Tax=Bifidobacterium panos TaxID=2675321 RepID=A0ABX1SXL9_9BIFI|nr:2-amino-4-hydroxy-6-hydroxymethyldihydropteridine diphosphokinase [Bifidobacterium sp. DSM 109963]NMN02570.1 2-amino-4-hydroxy-6- hydroxymethyldihydropteridin e pyrophosphokinase [Bifidobacterium sp. DSM 109963]